MNYQKIQIQKIFLKDNAKIVIIENEFISLFDSCYNYVANNPKQT